MLGAQENRAWGFAPCAEVGHSGAQMLGAYVLELFGVTPRGAQNEGAAFENLWLVALLAAALPTLTIVLIPWCAPAVQRRPVERERERAPVLRLAGQERSLGRPVRPLRHQVLVYWHFICI